MKLHEFNEVTLDQRVSIIQEQGRFIARRQSTDRQMMLYQWGNYFLEIHYRLETFYGVPTEWMPFLVISFRNGSNCAGRLLPYVDHTSLEALNI